MSQILDFVLILLLATGSFFAFLGAFSLIKLSSFLRRLHGPTKASTMGVGCILVASILFHSFYGTGLHPRELLIVVFLFLTAPVSAHLMSRATLSLMGELPPTPPRPPDPDGAVREDVDNRNA